MFKKTVLALTTLALLGGAAAPALAATDTNQTGLFGNGSYDDQALNRSFVIANLQAKGIDAVAVEQWGNLIRAYVRTPDGQQVQQFFTPYTLQPVHVNG